MTTIVWDGKILAADRGLFAGSRLDGEYTKIHRRKKDGALIGLAGRTSSIAAYVKWFLAGEKREAPKLHDDSQAMIIRPDGEVSYVDEYGQSPWKTDFYAIGAGAEFALGALANGSSAENAIKIAAKFDCFTNIEKGIDTLELSK